MFAQDYIGLKLNLNSPEFYKVQGYLTARIKDEQVSAEYTSGGELACINVLVLKPGKLETLARELRELIPGIEINVLPKS